jgi:hypothetical protein
LALSHVRRRTPAAPAAVILLIALLAALVVPFGATEAATAATLRSISGRVYLGTTSTPATPAEVVVEYRQVDAEHASAKAVALAADGSYRIDGLPDQTGWYLYFRYTGTDSFASQYWQEEPAVTDPFQRVYLNGADATGVDPVLERKGFVQGVVTLGDASVTAPADSVVVSFRVLQGSMKGWSPWSEGVPVDADGRYRIPDLLPTTSLQLRYEYRGDGPFQSLYSGGQHYEHAASSLAVGSPWAPNGTRRDVTLPAKVGLSGRVFLGSTATSAPAGSVRVSLEYGSRSWNDPTWTWQPVPDAAVFVDADGGYRFEGLLSASYHVVFEYVAGTGYAPRTTESVNAAAVRTLDATLKPAYTLSGRVFLGSTDRPAKAGEVLVTADRHYPSDAPDFGPVPTAADGSYMITGLPNAYYEVKLHYTGDEDFPDLTWTDAVCNVLGCMTSISTDRTGYDMVMERGRGVHGIVRDSAGKPLAAMTVRLSWYSTSSDQWISGGETSTAADGSYRFNAVADGEWSVQFSDPAGLYATSRWPGISEYYEPWRLDLRNGRDPGPIDVTMLRAGSIQGTITGEGFVPAPGRLAVEVLVYDDHVAGWVGTGDRYPVDSAGRYGIPGLQPDWYRVVAWYDEPLAHGQAASGILILDERETITANLEVDRLAVAPARDFSEDDLPDVLVRSGTGNLLRYAGNGQGGWGQTAVIGSGWNVMSLVLSAGDFSGDGHTDILARDGRGDLWLYPRDGRGGWSTPSRVGWGWSSFSELFSPGDFDGDREPDVMARDSAGNLWLYRGDGSGGWLGAVKVGTGWGHLNRIFAAGDFNGDGTDDVMARDGYGRLWLYPGDGAGGWLTPTIVGSGWNGFTAILGVGDFDGDTGPDLMGRDSAGDLWLYRGNGAGGWHYQGAGEKIGSGWSGLLFVD